MRILIAGLGSMGKSHAMKLLSLGERDLLFLRRKPNPVPEIPDVPVFTELDAALEQQPENV